MQTYIFVFVFVFCFCFFYCFCVEVHFVLKKNKHKTVWWDIVHTCANTLQTHSKKKHTHTQSKKENTKTHTQIYLEQSTDVPSEQYPCLSGGDTCINAMSMGKSGLSNKPGISLKNMGVKSASIISQYFIMHFCVCVCVCVLLIICLIGAVCALLCAIHTPSINGAKLRKNKKHFVFLCFIYFFRCLKKKNMVVKQTSSIDCFSNISCNK